MSAIPFINVGSRTKRAYFNKQHDVNTTSGFGFCQPTLVEYLPADTKVSLQQKQFVRLAPLPCPTFGRIQVRNITRFIPIHDVCENYDYLQSGQMVKNAAVPYQPSRVDSMQSNELLHWMICQSIGCFGLTRGVDNVPFFRAAIFTNGKVTTSDPTVSNDVIKDASIGRTQYSTYFRDVLNSEQAKQTYARYYSGWSFVNMLCRDSDGDFVNSPLANAISEYTGVTNWYGRSLGVLANDIRPKIGWFLDTSNHPASVNPSSPQTGSYPYGDQAENNSIGYLYHMVDAYNLQTPFYGVEDYIKQEFNEPITLENADYQIKFTVSGKTWHYLTDGQTSASTPGDFTHSTDYTVILCLRLTSVGRRVMSVLNACDFKFGIKYRQSLLPLFAYYKAWFDEYNPGRNTHWKTTNAYTLIHSNYDSGYMTEDFLINSVPGNYFTTTYKNRVIQSFFGFLEELAQCYYTSKPDNVTVATETPLLQVNNNTNLTNGPRLLTDNEDSSFYATAGVSSGSIYGDSYGGGDFPYTGGLGIKLLERVYHLVNKNSVIGSQIDKYLKSHFGYGLPESNKLGENNFYCNVSDVMSTVQNSESYLGEYAGKGIGSNHDPNNKVIAPTLHFDSKVPGYLISMLCIVPVGGYSQGVFHHPIERYDFYQSEFDSLGMAPMLRSEVLATRPLLNAADEEGVFGFVPRYFQLKVKNNLVNGGFAQRSQRSQFLPYMLDRLFTEDEYIVSNDDSGLNLISSPQLVADESLRFIGNNEKYGNFDRIFYDTTGLTDNFIIHIINDFKQWSPMKAVSNSYDTFDDEVDTSDRSVEHS